MTSFVHTAYPAQHPGVARIESTVRTARQLRKGFDSSKALAALLLAAMVATLMVVASQMVDNWSDDGHQLATWVLLWAIGFAALALCAGAARNLARRAVAGLDAWSVRVARRRADARFLAAAQHDPRVMAELKAALSRQDADPDVAAPSQVPRAAEWLAQYSPVFDWRGSAKGAPVRTSNWWEHYAAHL